MAEQASLFGLLDVHVAPKDGPCPVCGHHLTWAACREMVEIEEPDGVRDVSIGWERACPCGYEGSWIPLGEYLE